MKLLILCLAVSGCAAVSTHGDCNIKLTKITEVQCKGNDNEYKSIIVFPQTSPAH